MIVGSLIYMGLVRRMGVWGVWGVVGVMVGMGLLGGCVRRVLLQVLRL